MLGSVFQEKTKGGSFLPSAGIVPSNPLILITILARRGNIKLALRRPYRSMKAHYKMPSRALSTLHGQVEAHPVLVARSARQLAARQARQLRDGRSCDRLSRNTAHQ